MPNSFSCLLWWKISEFTIYILSADGNCFILHVSSVTLSPPPGLPGFSFCPSLESLNQGWLLADESNLWHWEAFPQGEICGERRTEPLQAQKKLLSFDFPSLWVPKISIYKQSLVPNMIKQQK